MGRMKKEKVIIVLVAVVAIIGIGFYLYRTNNTQGKLDGFAKCLADNGAVFYGAFWCAHCQNQKKMFGRSEKLLSYVECSTPSGREQLQVCKDKEIEGYPTWEFTDGTREVGEVALAKLAEKTKCTLPE